MPGHTCITSASHSKLKVTMPCSMVHVIEKFSMDSWTTTLFLKNMIDK